MRSFCRRCGTPLIYERAHSPHMVNIPRALFASRTGRQPLYHVGIEEMQDWTYAGEKLVPLKGFPGVVWKDAVSQSQGDDGPRRQRPDARLFPRSTTGRRARNA